MYIIIVYLLMLCCVICIGCYYISIIYMEAKGNKLGGIVSEDKIKEYQSWHLDGRGMVADEERNAFFKSLRSKPANRACIDCMTRNPVWISTGFGVFVCLNCSGRHRQMGVHVTFVRSCEMDKLPPQYLIQMDIGGNERARDFFKQHNMGPGCSKPIDYHGRWAAKYRQMLQKEVDDVMSQLHYDIPNGEEIENGDKDGSSSSTNNPMVVGDRNGSTTTAGAADERGSTSANKDNHDDKKKAAAPAAPIVIRKRQPIAPPVVVKVANPTANTTHHTSSIFADDAGEQQQVDDFFDRLEKEAAANPKPLPIPSTKSPTYVATTSVGGFVKPDPSKVRYDTTATSPSPAVAAVHSPTYSKSRPSYGTPSGTSDSAGAVPDRLREKRGISSDDFFDALSPSYANPSQSERLPASFATRQSFGSDDFTPGGARREGSAAVMDFDDIKTSAAVAAEKGLQYASKGYEALSSYMRRQAGDL